MSNVTLLKNCSQANKKDLTKLLVNVQNILDSYNELHERMDRSPLMVRLFLEENGGKVDSLNDFRESIARHLATEAQTMPL